MTRAYRLLQIAFDRRGLTHLGLVGILTELTAGAALPEKVPALIQRSFDASQLLMFWVFRTMADGLRFKAVLLGHKPAYLGQDGFVIHDSLLLSYAWLL
jgi:hypothetical protein